MNIQFSVSLNVLISVLVIVTVSSCRLDRSGIEEESNVEDNEGTISVVRHKLSSDPPDSNCSFEIYNGHEYWFCNNDSTWGSARDKCLAVGGDLVTIEDGAEDSFVHSVLLEPSWIGATDESVENEWIWISTSEQFWDDGLFGGPVGGLYSNWDFSEPGFGDCARMRTSDGQWESESCNFAMNGYVCELNEVDPESGPDGDCVFLVDDGHKYWFCDKSRDWQKARQKCQTVGGDLVQIDDEAENAFVYFNMLRLNDLFLMDFERSWIGATDQDIEGDWIWIGNGEQFWDGGFAGTPVGGRYANWNALVEPSFGDCARMRTLDAQWESTDCDVTDSYICEIDQVVQDSAPESDCTLGTFNGSNYYFCENERQFDDARERCQSVGMDLAVIETQEEDDWLNGFIDEHVWIGASDIETAGEWKWLYPDQLFWSNYAPVGSTYTNWEAGYPDFGPIDGDCAAKNPPFSLGTWETFECWTHNAYLCEHREMIQEVQITPEEVCPGGTIHVEVTSEDPANPGFEPIVTINGTHTSELYDQLRGVPGKRLIAVAAHGSNGTTESLLVEANVVDCGASAPEAPLLYGDFNIYEPDVVDFTVLNASVFEDATTHYIWIFGDGTAVDTPLPAVSHRYDPPPPGEENQTVDVSVTVKRTGVGDVTARLTFVIWDNYAIAKQRGVLEPPAKPVDPVLLELPDDFYGEFEVKNREDSVITFDRRRIDQRACDPDTADIIGAEESIDITAPPHSELPHGIRFEKANISAETCGFNLIYWGATAEGTPAQFSVQFDLPGGLDGPDVTPFMEDLLNYVVENDLVANPYRVTGRELSQLYRERKIRYSVANDVFYQSSPLPPNALDWCNPENPGAPPQVGYSCQPTGGWYVDGKYAWEDHIANAQKGDTVLVRSCGGFIWDMMNKLDPPQLYTHTGIMTKNKYEIRQSTGSVEYLMSKHNGVFGQPSDGFQEYYLRYLWPGTLTSTVQEAFITSKEISDPDGNSRKIKGFNRSEARCTGDQEIVWPRVLKPEPQFEEIVRPMLHAAADSSKNIQAHYRFSVYSNAPDTAAEDPNGPNPILDANGHPVSWGKTPTVCSAFVRLALKGAGIEVDKDKSAPFPSDVQMNPPDGIFYYDQQERLAAGKALYANLYNSTQYALEMFEEEADDYWWIATLGAAGESLADFGSAGVLFAAPIILEEIGDLFGFFTDISDDVSSQITNCFATDYCSENAKDSDDWKENVSYGFAVSPDDIMRHYDEPSIDANGVNQGGVYGYHEAMVYRDKRYRPHFAWLPAPGTRTVSGTVFNEQSDGSLVSVEGASVEILGVRDKTDTTDATGHFSILAVPGGNLLVHATKTFPDTGEFKEGISCYIPDDPSNPAGLMAQVDCEDFSIVIATGLSEANVVLRDQPHDEEFRHVIISGSAELVDCDCKGPDVTRHYKYRTYYKTCDVSKLDTTKTFNVTQQELCNDEVGLRINGTCEYLPDNSVHVFGTIGFYEEESDSCGANDLVDDYDFDYIVAPGWSVSQQGWITHNDLCWFGPFPHDCDDSTNWGIGVSNQEAP